MTVGNSHSGSPCRLVLAPAVPGLFKGLGPPSPRPLAPPLGELSAKPTEGGFGKGPFRPLRGHLPHRGRHLGGSTAVGLRLPDPAARKFAPHHKMLS